MPTRSYFVLGEIEEGIESALAYIESELGLSTIGNPDVMTLRHGLLSVDDARRLRSLAELSSTIGSQKVLIISAARLFHEAQNALLKLFEEPPEGTLLILILPSEGMLLPTLRSRLLPLPFTNKRDTKKGVRKEISKKEAQEFIDATSAEREKMLTKLLDRTKVDKDDEKQAARLSAIHLVEGLMEFAYGKWQSDVAGKKKEELKLFLEDLNTFLPILHERSAPLKLIFEHLLIVMPF